jgi:hypothetical protein
MYVSWRNRLSEWAGAIFVGVPLMLKFALFVYLPLKVKGQWPKREP